MEHSYTYTVYMKNITLSLDDKVLSAVRLYAAEQNSSVNALVREYLTNLAAHQNRAARARARLRQLSKQSQGRLGRKTWTREELHDR
jgi:plasmid stability protein